LTNPAQPIGDLELLNEEERKQLLDSTRIQIEYPQYCLHELFEEQAARTPTAVAVQFEGQQLTYRELNQYANQVAHHLKSLGAGPEVLVAICMERSVEMVAAIVAILKTGAAYVPLDANYPPERIGFMLQ